MSRNTSLSPGKHLNSSKGGQGDLDIAGTSEYLQKWLSGHILHTDMDYRKFKECSA